MKLNNKGFAISGIIYALMILFLILMFAILGLLGSRKVILDKIKKSVSNEIENNEEIINSSKIDKSGANSPELTSGMIPVIYDGTNWVKATFNSEYDQNWYNYDKKEWANAVLVNEESRAIYESSDPGIIINDSDILGFYVWIPRYSYKLFNTVDKSSVSEQKIDIKFEKITSKNSGSSNNEYLTHPAFTFDGNELSGIWVSKFSMTGDISNLTSLPNKTPITNNSIASMFYAAINMKTENNIYGLSNVDSHMIKNTELGSVLYLTQSIYGLCNGDTCSEIGINNYYNSSYMTGCGNSANSSVSSTCKDYKNYYASSTGNISGVYDLSTIYWTAVMGNMSDSTGNFYSANSSITTTIDSKYYDTYSYDESNLTSNRGLFGDGTKEVMLNYGNINGVWYSGYSSFVNKTNPWFRRGGLSGTYSSMYSYSEYDGSSSSTTSFRTVIVNE